MYATHSSILTHYQRKYVNYEVENVFDHPHARLDQLRFLADHVQCQLSNPLI